ncbi:Peptidase C2, calpain family [Phytophthora cactorum]|nr:Peptidase C2, calpain family [Phytophthora cactorum]
MVSETGRDPLTSELLHPCQPCAGQVSNDAAESAKCRGVARGQDGSGTCCLATAIEGVSSDNRLARLSGSTLLDDAELAAFSCTGGARNCPDGGQYASAGGNLTLTIVEMRNLPDLDSFGLAGLETDAYVEALIGDNVRTSGVVWNSLNPKWPPCAEPGCTGESDVARDLNFGFRPAGTEIVVRVWDKDSGFEFGDDLVAQVTLNAIYCSAFSAFKQKLPSNDTSTWAIAEQPMCVEELWIPLSESGDCTDVKSSAPCMRVRMTAIPFQMRTEEVFVSGALVNGGMGGYFPDEESWLYGRVYSSSDTRLLSYYRMADSQGGLLIRSSSTSNNHKGNTSLISTYGYAPYARVTLNFAAQLFVFRRVDDEASSPEWLNTTFGWVETREYAQLMDVAGDLKAVAQNFTPHAINKYGDAEGRGIITGANVALNDTDTTLSMYFIVAVPHESLDVVPAVYSKEFSRGIFLEITIQYGTTFTFLMILVLRYLQRMHWRIERVQSFLAEKVANPNGQLSAAAGSQPKVKEKNDATKGKDKTGATSVKKTKVKKPDIVAQLFFCYGDGENNAQFRRNLYYATWAVNIVIASPVLMLLSWGVTSIVLVTPPAFGFGIVFLGIGALGGIYAAAMWTTLYLFAVAFFGAFVFLFSATFADPKVYVGGEDLDFFSLSSIFLTLNMMPIIWLAFTNDSKLSKSLKQVIAVVGVSKKVTTLKSKFKNLGTLGLKLANAKSDHQIVDLEESRTKRKRKESAFAAILGDHYTVEQSLPGLEYADILKSAFVAPVSTRKRMNRRCYWSALATLVVYCIVASAWTEYGTQALGISITLVLVDLCVYMLHRGKSANNWSAGYVVFLLSSVRVYWILGHAFLYMVFGTALCREIIGRNLPRMNKQEAGGVTFFGHDPQKERQQQLDVGTTPEFVLGFLSFFYLFLLLGVAFGSDSNQTVHVPVLGQEWPLWIFGVLAFIVVLFVGLSLATSRAFFLQKEQLLSDYAMHVYLFVQPLRLPFMLAAASEILVICSGLFVYASTQSTFILVSSFFAPLILMLSLAVHVQWKKNDYRLVVWPPEDDEEDVLDDDDDGGFLDAAAALEKEAELMRENFVLPPLKGKGNNHVFDSADETFKMPNLPSKSLLGLGGGKAAGVMRKSKPTPDKTSTAKTPVAITETGANNTTLAIQPAKPPRFAWLRDLMTGKISCRAFCSRKTWSKKYREADNLSPTANPLLNRNGVANTAPDDDDEDVARPLLDDNAVNNAVLARRKTMALGLQARLSTTTRPHDYRVLLALLFLVMLYGMILTATENPSWLGQLIWTGAYVLIFTISPTIKFFKTATFTPDMKYCFGGSAVLAWITGFVLFFAVLKADVNQVESLVILSIMVFYPIFLLFAVTLGRWQDENWVITRPIRRTGGACMVAIVLWIFEMYVFVSVAFGGVLTFLLVLFLFITYYVVKWRSADESVFYSPYLFPVFSYNAFTNNVVDETHNVLPLYMVFLLVFLWGVAGVMFFDPLGFGVGLCSLVLLAFAGVTAHLCAVTPYVNEMILKDASDAAQAVANRRSQPFTLESPEFVEQERREKKAELEFQAIAYGGASDARLSREKILFQKFLRENRFKLMSNGISPPANVFRTSSFASIDIPLVAVWLLSLTPEARARFHALKAAFNEEMERTDTIVDAEDRAALVAQKDLREHWAPREAEQCRQRMQEFLARRLRRESEGILTEEEESKPGYDEGLVNAREALLEIESGYSCVSGEFGRSLQFVDREFPPDTTSLVGCSHESEIAPQWKVSSAINVASGLFDGGTDPDDVRVGRLDDAWLLSALSIMAASGGVDDGKVDALIDRLFVTKQTSLTGAYALRLYQNCQWETVIVDDYFPVLYDSAEREAAGMDAGDDAELSVSAGAAFAHSRDFEELWVPLVEKAFAKYYGGYAALEGGYVHHALRVLSGCDARSTEENTVAAVELFRKNRFLLGAASLPSEHADPALRATGLVFDACYVIYDVRDVDGAQLLQLRNPPGDHQEWKGDWSDSSRLWTRRLRKRLGVRKGDDTGDDNTFWMSFDDFCHAFRALYVCRYYDPDKWTAKTLDARFSREDATSSGLTTRHNPGCTGLDNNPHFSLRVSRPTEVIVTVTQVDSRGMAPVTVLPIAVYIVAHQDQKDRARRVTVLNQDNVTAHSGVPARNREVRIQCELAARTYTLLVAAYVSGMEEQLPRGAPTDLACSLEDWQQRNVAVPHGTLVERMAEKMKHTVTESAAGAKIMAKTHELADKIAASAAIVDNVMRDEESILEEQLAKQQQEEADEAERQETRLTGKKKKKTTSPDAPQSNPWIEQWDEGAGKPFYFNKQTGMSSWEKPADF